MKYVYALLFIMFVIFLGYTVNGVMTFADQMKTRANMINHALEGK
jgi:hypothetical protein